MKKLIAILLLCAALPLVASAQIPGQFPAGTVYGNSTASGGIPKPVTVTALFDRALCATNNSAIARISGTWVCLATANNGVWITSSGGVPSISSTLPSAVQDNITRVGTLVSGATGAGFTINLGTSTISGDLAFANIAQIATARVLGRTTAATGDIESLTGTQATALLDACVGDAGAGGTKGLVPAPAAGDAAATKFLKADCTWTAVSGTGTVTSITPGNGLTSTLTATAPGSAITTAGTLSGAQLVNAQTGTSYAILDGDRAKLITASNAAAQAYSIAQAGTASAFQAGWWADIENKSTDNAGVVTITPTTSTINGAATLVLQPFMAARIISDGTNYQVIFHQTSQKSAFSVHKNGTNQTGIADNTSTLLTWSTEAYDIGGNFASNGWTPPAGLVTLQCMFFGTGTITVGVLSQVTIQKNSADYKSASVITGTNQAGGLIVADDRADGDDVYTCNVLVDVTSGTTTVIGTASLTAFLGHWIGP